MPFPFELCYNACSIYFFDVSLAHVCTLPFLPLLKQLLQQSAFVLSLRLLLPAVLLNGSDSPLIVGDQQLEGVFVVVLDDVRPHSVLHLHRVLPELQRADRLVYILAAGCDADDDACARVAAEGVLEDFGQWGVTVGNVRIILDGDRVLDCTSYI